jgi:hypothetical protein
MIPNESNSSRPLKNYLRWQYCVKSALGKSLRLTRFSATRRASETSHAHLQPVNSSASPVRSSAAFSLSCLPRQRFSTAYKLHTMDSPKPPQKPAQLLNDLESIRKLLGDENLEPPLLIDSLDPDSIPLLSEIVTPPPSAAAPMPAPKPTPPAAAPTLRQTVSQSVSHDSELNRLNSELRAAAELILQDVIDDFVPQIEAELKRRLEARLPRLLPPRR